MDLHEKSSCLVEYMVSISQRGKLIPREEKGEGKGALAVFHKVCRRGAAPTPIRPPRKADKSQPAKRFSTVFFGCGPVT